MNPDDIFRAAEEHAEFRYESGRRDGAAVGMGLLLMAMAINETHWRNIVVVERRY